MYDTPRQRILAAEIMIPQDFTLFTLLMTALTNKLSEDRSYNDSSAWLVIAVGLVYGLQTDLLSSILQLDATASPVK